MQETGICQVSILVTISRKHGKLKSLCHSAPAEELTATRGTGSISPGVLDKDKRDRLDKIRVLVLIKESYLV